MKRILIIVLCFCIIMTGCQRKVEVNKDGAVVVTKDEDQNPENNDKNTIEQNENDDKNSKENDAVLGLKINEEWSAYETVAKKAPVLTIPKYEVKVDPYTIADNLSNIENIEQFSGFTKKQKSMLVENGFVVLPSQDTRMYYAYDSNEYSGLPNFITTDSVLNMYHQFYNKSLYCIESDFLYEDLELMTEQMLTNSIELLKELEDNVLIKLQEKNIIYFLVASMLMSQSSEITAEVQPDLMKVAKEEYNLIDMADGYAKSPSMKIEFDYSQFKIRGHYTKSEELGRFFRTMMWFGTAPLSLYDENKVYDYENTLQALLMTFTTFLESKGISNAELWSNIYIPTSQYVGLSDDINVFTLNNLRISVFGEGNDPNIFHEEVYYDKLYEAVKDLPEPKIQAELIATTIPTGKQFRFMGQRYILDSYTMQKLTDSILRPIPSSLDVMGVLGSDLAENILFSIMKPQDIWPEYTERYKQLEEEVSSYSDDIWSNNLYNGWIWSLKELLIEFEKNSGMPVFMTTDAWKNKSLNTALGSYTELKHDTVLYGKQSTAEMGGPTEFANQHYVEPNVPLYSKLLYLTEYTISVLEERGMMNEKLLEGAKDYKTMLELLLVCSIKELRNEVLTEEENKKLLWYGGTLENISYSFTQGMTKEYDAIDVSDMLVTDIATFQNTYLSLGTGFFDHIYVVVPVNGKLYLTRGSVYSFYEFVSDSRLTDEEWWKLNGINVIHQDYGDYIERTEPSAKLPEQPFWVDMFKTNSNDVQIESLEVNWDKLKE